jgi:hypothetical protein
MVSGHRVASEIAYEHGYCVVCLIGTRLIHCITSGQGFDTGYGGICNLCSINTQGYAS